MSFFEIVCYNIITESINFVIFFWAGSNLLERRVLKGWKWRIRMLALSFGVVAALAVTAAAFYVTGLLHWASGIGSVVISYLQLFLQALVLKLIYQERILPCWGAAVFTGVVGLAAENVGYLFSPLDFFHVGIPEERRLYMFYQGGLVFFVDALLILFLCRKGAGKIYRNWMEKKDIWRGGIVFLSFYPVFDFLITLLGENDRWDNKRNYMLSIILILIIAVIFDYAGRVEMQKKELEARELSLRQQNHYIETLEELQGEMRRFRHDYKNMMAGIYLQAREGELEAVQDFIQEMTEEFENQVGGQIKYLTQLRNVYMPEIKGLLLNKMEKMQRLHIKCELEVRSPFRRTRFRIVELCRCLGILIDNAIDEVRGKEGAKIYIMISSQEECTTFRVKNRLYSSVDFHKIWQQGYSTRGKDRGIGLTSYKKIVDSYDYVLSLTAIQDGCFIQELKIQE